MRLRFDFGIPEGTRNTIERRLEDAGFVGGFEGEVYSGHMDSDSGAIRWDGWRSAKRAERDARVKCILGEYWLCVETMELELFEPTQAEVMGFVTAYDMMKR